jgi:hypothetical protein
VRLIKTEIDTLASSVHGGDIHIASTTAAQLLLEQTSTDNVDLGLKRSGGTTSEWHIYIPGGQTDLRFYNGGDQMKLSTGGVITGSTWQGNSISTTYTDAKVTSVTKTGTGIVVSPTTGATLVRLLKTEIDTVGALASGSITSGFGAIATSNAITGQNITALGYLTSDSTILGGGGANGVLQINYYQSGEGGGDWLSTIRFLGTGNRSHWLPDSSGTFVLKEYLGSMAYADSATYHGSASITTLGTIASGTWQGSSITTTYTAAKYVGTYHSRADTPSSPVEGDVWHDSDDDILYIYAGGGWRQVASW